MTDYLTTARLVLTRLTNTNPGAQHVQWYHDVCTDENAASYNFQIAPSSLEESRQALHGIVDEGAAILFAVHILETNGDMPDMAKPNEIEATRGQHIGMVTLTFPKGSKLPLIPRNQAATSLETEPDEDETMAAMPGLKIDEKTGTSPEADPDGGDTMTAEPESKSWEAPEILLLGYAFFKFATGHAYATEACSTVIQDCQRQINSAGHLAYIEAHIDTTNKKSVRLAERLGFHLVGTRRYMDTVDVTRIRAYKGMLKWMDVYGQGNQPWLQFEEAWIEPSYYVYGMWTDE